MTHNDASISDFSESQDGTNSESHDGHIPLPTRPVARKRVSFKDQKKEGSSKAKDNVWSKYIGLFVTIFICMFPDMQFILLKPMGIQAGSVSAAVIIALISTIIYALYQEFSI